MKPSRPNLKRSQALLRRARRRIPAATQTLSKGPTQFVQGVAPVFAHHGKGAYLFDVDGHRYLDFPMALGPVILGYADPAVDAAIRRQLREGGISYSLPHPLEVEVAELLCRTIPCADWARFAKNGSDVTAAAVRLARAHTGRDLVLQCGYHGWQDWHIATSTRNKGIPQAVRDLTVSFPYNDLAHVERLLRDRGHEVACVVMEPVGVDPPMPGFLEGVRDAAHAAGALLVFDEVVTGFRLALGGAQAHFGVVPDLACVGKAMGNGMPISALVGSAELMPTMEDLFFSMTFAGETLSLAAAFTTIQEMKRRRTIAHLWRVGRRLDAGVRRLVASHGLADAVRVKGLAPRVFLDFAAAGGATALEVKSLFQQEALLRAVLTAGSHNVTGAHGDREIAATLKAYDAALETVAGAIRRRRVAETLLGPPVQPVFRAP